MALDVPLVAVNHIHAQRYACRVASGVDVLRAWVRRQRRPHDALPMPFAARVPQVLGGTMDDAGR